MKIPGFDKAYGHALNWGLRGDGLEVLHDFVEAHSARARKLLPMTGSAVPESLGGDLQAVAVAVAADDFLTYPLDADGESVIGNYLRRRGWKESAPGKAVLRALEQSVMSLYEVVAVSPSRVLTLRDLVRGGDTIEAHDTLAAAIPDAGIRIGLRLFQWKGQHHIARGVLPFSKAGASGVLAAVSILRGSEATGRSADPSSWAAVGPPLADAEWLRDNAPLFTNFWLIDIESDEWVAEYLLRDALGDLSWAKVAIPVLGDMGEAEAALAGMPGVEQVTDRGFLWTGKAAAGDGGEDAVPGAPPRVARAAIRGTESGELDLTVTPADLAGVAIAAICEALAGKVGTPVVTLDLTGEQMPDFPLRSRPAPLPDAVQEVA